MNLEKLLQAYTIRQAPLAKGLSVDENASLLDVLQTLRENKAGCAVLMHNFGIRGIFTERDFLSKVVLEIDDWSVPISRFATSSPYTLKQSDTVDQAIALMREKNIRNIPIVDADEKLIGILTLHNILKLFAEHFPEDVLNLPPRLRSNAKTPEGG